MKTNHYVFAILYVLLSLFASCSSYTIPQDEENEKSKNEELPVTIGVRSGSSELNEEHYPITVYVFKSDGKLVSQHLIESKDKDFSTNLKPGEYKISAFSGLNKEVYSYSETPDLNSLIEIKNNVSNKSPLMAGHSDISISKASDIKISMSYIVSSIKMAISNIPDDTQEVTLSISPVSKGYKMNGSYTNDGVKATVKCKKSEDKWISEELFLLPSESSSTVLSINVSRSKGDETYSYTYRNKLEAAQPYSFSGKYNEGISIDGSFEINGWKPGIDIEFDFNETGESDNSGESGTDGNKQDNNDESNHNYDKIETVYFDSLPEKNSFWKDFYVWTVKEISANEVEAIIISSQQWPQVHTDDVKSYLAEYEEGGITGWRTFTKDEAKAFHKEFSNVMSDFNYKLSNNGHNRFYYNDKERYFCENGTHTFSLAGSFRVTKAGDKTFYYLRPLKTIRIKTN